MTTQEALDAIARGETPTGFFDNGVRRDDEDITTDTVSSRSGDSDAEAGHEDEEEAGAPRQSQAGSANPTNAGASSSDTRGRAGQAGSADPTNAGASSSGTRGRAGPTGRAPEPPTATRPPPDPPTGDAHYGVPLAVFLAPGQSIHYLGGNWLFDDGQRRYTEVDTGQFRTAGNGRVAVERDGLGLDFVRYYGPMPASHGVFQNKATVIELTDEI